MGTSPRVRGKQTLLFSTNTKKGYIPRVRGKRFQP